MSPPASERSLPSKRRKTQLACHPCRARKTGCDGRKPFCSACTMRGWQDRCGYQETSASSSAPTLISLDRRLRKLEETTPAQLPSPTSEIRETDSASIRVSASDRRNSHGEDAAIREASIRPRSPAVESESAHGAPSNSLFVQQVASVISSGDERVNNTDLDPRYSISSHSADAHSLNDLVLPPRQLADGLLQCYWELFHSVRPILHRPTFEAAYGKLWQPIEVSGLATHNRTHNVVFYATLNIALALGCQHNEALGETERENLTSEFYKRSVRLVSVDALDTSSLQIVQLLLLRGFYLISTPYADRCWTTVGVAIRVAQAVGLQSATPSANQLDREMRRRVWHTCILLDWLTSISFDRPRTLSRDTSIPLPEPIDDEYLSDTGEGQQPHNVPSRLAFIPYLINIYSIRDKSRSTETKYPNISKKRYSGQELGATLDLSSELDDLLEDLPPYLRDDHGPTYPASGNEACFQLQSRVLKASVMYARLAILRPFVVAEASRCASATASDWGMPKSTVDVQNTLYKDLCTLCVSTAHDTLEHMYCYVSTVYRSSPWHSLYFTFAAASVLVAAKLCPYLDIQFDRDPCRASWDKAMHIFAFHRTHVASAEKGIEALKRFRNYIDTRGRATTHVIGSVGSNAKHVSAGGSDPIASSMTLDSSFAGQPTLEISDLIDPGPIDESWLVSQEFYFDDSMMQWP